MTLLFRTLAIALLLLLAVPASAEIFIGTAKVTGGCYGTPTSSKVIEIALEIGPGAGFGQLTTATTTIALTTDWIPDGKGAYFAASAADPGVGAFVYYGTIKGTKLKGYFAEHSYTGCVFTGKLKAATLQ